MAKECSNSSCSKESCEGCPSKAGQGKPDFHIDLNADSSIKHVIGVVSGKGGVGKSLVTSLIASALVKQGKNVGILDADITGPSIPRMFGIEGKAMGSPDGLLPAVAADGTKVMSTNLLLENDTDPVIWRGPMIAGVVKQFWSDVVWGDIDYLLVDMPPGTGDVPLTVFQSLPVDGIIVVTSPQELVGMIVAKAVNMAEAMKVPVLGLVENMAYFVCPNCNEKHYLFGESQVDVLAQEYEIGATAQIPTNPTIAALCDAGKVDQVFQALLFQRQQLHLLCQRLFAVKSRLGHDLPDIF